MRRFTILVLFISSFAGCGDDGSSSDTGTLDTGASDTGSADTGSADTGAADTGTGDTAAGDTGAGDTGAADTGTADSGPTCAPAGDACTLLPCCVGSACDSESGMCMAGLECIELGNDCGGATPCCGPGTCVSSGGAGGMTCSDERGCIPPDGDCSGGGDCCAGYACGDGTCLPTP